jgi:glycine cleavage system H protein
LNVPAGIFVSKQHAWAKIESNGTIRVGPDDLIRKIFEKVENVELPEKGQKIKKGETLFALKFGDYSLQIPSPVSGKITSVNVEHAEHPEWLAIKPFGLSWMCGIEPSNLAGELPDLIIGRDSVDWYQQEIDRYQALSAKFIEDPAKDGNAEYTKLLRSFSQPFLQAGNLD